MKTMRVVWPGTTLPKEQEKDFVDWMAENGFKDVKVVGTIETLPGQGGDGGRHDLVFDLPVVVSDGVKGKFVTWRLQYGMRWADDYYLDSCELIPDFQQQWFVGYGYAETEKEFYEQNPVESPASEDKPSCKLIGEDGNVFNIIGRVQKALKKAGLRDEATEFVEKAQGSKSYDEVLKLCMDYVDVC